jgi:hypothetical protein
VPVRRGKGGDFADEQKAGFVYFVLNRFFGGLEEIVMPHVNIQPERITPSYQVENEDYH